MTVGAVVSIIRNVTREWSWADLRREISDRSFISTIVNFDTDSLKGNVRKHVDKDYINSKAWVV